MRIISWNVAHQTRERKISTKLLWALGILKPDVLSLTEYVHGESRQPFLQGLAELGLRHVQISQRFGKNNQVLIASRYPIELGCLVPPRMKDGISESNFLHVTIPEKGMDFVGIRVPAYRLRSDLHSYWKHFCTLVRSTTTRRVVYIGDFNADPDSNIHVGSPYINGLREDGWHLPSAEGLWSYASGSRLDHVVASPLVHCISARYVTELEGHQLAMKSISQGVSDHAALVVDIDPV